MTILFNKAIDDYPFILETDYGFLIGCNREWITNDIRSVLSC
jgi:hypothetical protein